MRVSELLYGQRYPRAQKEGEKGGDKWQDTGGHSTFEERKEMEQEANHLNEPEVAYESLGNKSALKLIDLVTEGIDYSSFSTIVNMYPFTLAEWCQFLNMPERTLQRYKRDQRKFDVLISEKILLLTMFFKYGASVFSDKQHFQGWLSSPNLALGNRTPKSLLSTDIGVGLVKDVIGRLEHGVYS